MKKNVVTFEGPIFYSMEDEELFFYWLYSLGAFKEVKGAGRELRVTFKRSRLSNKDRWELIAIFRRYNIDMRVLRPLLEPAEDWSPKLHWFKAVFRRTASKRPKQN